MPFVPNEYIPQVSQKIAVYQQLARRARWTASKRSLPACATASARCREPFENLVEITRLRVLALHAGVTRVVINEQRLTLGVGTGFVARPGGDPEVAIDHEKRFRFAEGKILVDLPTPNPKQKTEDVWMPLLRNLLEAM